MMDSVVENLKRGINGVHAFSKFQELQAKRYRANIFLKLMGFPIRFLIIFILWSIVLSGNQSEDMNYYIVYYAGVFLILLMYPYARMANATVGQDIFNGEIVKYLSKGIPYWSVRFADWWTVSKFYIPIVFSIYIAGVAVFYEMPSVFNIMAFFYLLFISSLMQLIVWTIVGIGAFWLEQTQGLSRLFGFVQEVLAGALIPLQLFPLVLQNINQYLPFQYFIYIPLQTLMGEVSADNIIFHMMLSSFWCVALLCIAFILWRKGLKHYISPL